MPSIAAAFSSGSSNIQRVRRPSCALAERLVEVWLGPAVKPSTEIAKSAVTLVMQLRRSRRRVLYMSRSQGDNEWANREGEDRVSSNRIRAERHLLVIESSPSCDRASGGRRGTGAREPARADVTPVFTLQSQGIWGAAQTLLGAGIYKPPVVEGGWSAFAAIDDRTYWTVSDRGPNGQPTRRRRRPARTFLAPAFTPTIYKVAIADNGSLSVLQRIPIHLKAGAVNPARAWMAAHPTHQAVTGGPAERDHRPAADRDRRPGRRVRACRPTPAPTRRPPRATRSRTPPTASRCSARTRTASTRSRSPSTRATAASGSATSTARRSSTSPPTARCSTASSRPA